MVNAPAAGGTIIEMRKLGATANVLTASDIDQLGATDQANTMHSMTIELVAERFILDASPPRKGGTGHVRRARDHQNRMAAVAIKFYDGEALDDELREECFLREREALRVLNHPNIVRMLDAGWDEVSHRHYVALEWLEQDLLDSLRHAEPARWSWPHIARDVLMPLLGALGAAHARRIWHRDIKPSNVMMGPDGAVRLTDFGIAKLVDSLRLGMTVREFHSRPYAPPEHRSDQVDERSDLYSLGVTAVRLLRGPEGTLAEHEDIPAAIARLDVPDDAKAFLGELTEKRQEDRPRAAKLARAELERLLVWEPRPRSGPQKQLKVLLTKTLLLQACDLFGMNSDADARRGIMQDLGQSASLLRDRHEPATWADESQVKLELVGQEFLYPCRFDADGSGTLVVLAIHAVPASLVERRRDAALPIDHVVTYKGSWARQREDADALIAALSAHEAVRREAEARRAEAGVFDRWWDVLNAKTELEARREDPLAYEGFGREGQLLTFRTLVDVDERYVGQERRVKMTGVSAVRGTVVEVGDRRLGLLVERGFIDGLPASGQLLVDRTLSRRAIVRQKNALSDVRDGEAVRSDLNDLLVHPDRLEPLPTVMPGSYLQALDAPKQSAVAAALSSPDFLVVKGPPGTGKTTFIVELIAQLLAGRPNARVLLSSQTHVAVDNAASSLAALLSDHGSPARIVRVGRADKVEPEAQHLTIAPQLRDWHAAAEREGRGWIAKWGMQRGVEPDALDGYNLAGELEAATTAHHKLSSRLDELKREEERLMDALTDPAPPAPVTSATGTELPDLEDELVAVQDQVEENSAELLKVEQTVNELGDSLRTTLHLGSDARARDFDEALKKKFSVDPQELDTYKQLVALQDAWLLRFGQGDDFEQALISSAQVVAGTCVGTAASLADADAFDLAVVDEASKAAPTEALMPMARSRRWVLVGDDAQLPPFLDSALLDEGLLEDHNLTRDDLRETLFGRLSANLPPDRVVELTEQHRMLAPIGKLVSECFYAGKLESSRGERSEFTSVRQAFAAPVTWLSTSKLGDRREHKAGTTYWNAAEIRVIRRALEKLQRCAEALNEEITVAVISGYGEQARRLRRDLRPGDPRWSQLEIDVHPIDSFQGQERDIVIYSVARSNRDGVLGFLASVERLNVALSRGRDGLVIVGDAMFCERASKSPFVSVIEHIRSAAGCALVELS